MKNVKLIKPIDSLMNVCRVDNNAKIANLYTRVRELSIKRPMHITIAKSIVK